jgi:hypothetical protein
VGKLKKVGIGFGIVILSFFVLAAIGGSVPDTEQDGIARMLDEIEKRQDQKSKSYEEMNSSELSLIAVQHDFKDLMRNSDDYVGKIIFVEGVVTNVQRDLNSINLCVDGATVSFYCDEFMFVNVNGIDVWLEEDNLAGYVEVKGISETFRTNVFGGGDAVGTGDYVPQVKEIMLSCSNC